MSFEPRFSLLDVTRVYLALPYAVQASIDKRAHEAAERVCDENHWKKVDLNDWSRALSKRYAYRLADSNGLAHERMRAFHELIETEINVGAELAELERRREES